MSFNQLLIVYLSISLELNGIANYKYGFCIWRKCFFLCLRILCAWFYYLVYLQQLSFLCLSSFHWSCYVLLFLLLPKIIGYSTTMIIRYSYLWTVQNAKNFPNFRKLQHVKRVWFTVYAVLCTKTENLLWIHDIEYNLKLIVDWIVDCEPYHDVNSFNFFGPFQFADTGFEMGSLQSQCNRPRNNGWSSNRDY